MRRIYGHDKLHEQFYQALSSCDERFVSTLIESGKVSQLMGQFTRAPHFTSWKKCFVIRKVAVNSRSWSGAERQCCSPASSQFIRRSHTQGRGATMMTKIDCRLPERVPKSGINFRNLNSAPDRLDEILTLCGRRAQMGISVHVRDLEDVPVSRQHDARAAGLRGLGPRRR